MTCRVKNSCGLALVIFQESSEAFTTLNRAYVRFVLAYRRKEEDAALVASPTWLGLSPLLRPLFLYDPFILVF